MTVLHPVPLDEVPSDLLAAARDAFAHAYAPYSGFRVGAAVRAGDGRVDRGANVENASYGLSRCAEQSAVQAMATRGERRLVEAVVVADADPVATPCGACRQVLAEFGPDATLFLVGARGAWCTTVGDLLPDGFELRHGTGR
ncbi:MAG: cytidine deaminase [Trueperaceae bacterium]|nr:cytidine deaminase [Trueperaceae bacterium]